MDFIEHMKGKRGDTFFINTGKDACYRCRGFAS